MNFLVVTGMSGAGKSQAANALEDIGYYCVDNIPPLIIPAFIDLFSIKENNFENLAIITDIRGGELFNDIIVVLGKLENRGVDYKILFITAEDDVLVKRYKENRRKHPLCSENTTISDAVKKERRILDSICKKADYIIDTTYMSSTQLKEKITNIFIKSNDDSMKIQCMSFGFKYGIPSDADLVFDVRCLPNPYYIDELRKLTGLDSKIRDFVMSSDNSKKFFDKICSLVDFSVPLYRKEGKSQLVIAFGCTGGKHRSVTFSELLHAHISEKGCSSITFHRDINKH